MNELLTITSPPKGSFLIKTFIVIFKMDRGHLSSRKCSTKSKGLNFNTVLSKEESDDSDVEMRNATHHQLLRRTPHGRLLIYLHIDMTISDKFNDHI